MDGLTSITVVIRLETENGNKMYHASVQVHDRTTTGIRDTLTACGDEVQRQIEVDRTKVVQTGASFFTQALDKLMHGMKEEESDA